jgi:hypothetical protein
VLPRLDGLGLLVYGEVAVFVEAEHVVGLEAGIKATRGLYSTDRGLGLKDDNFGI